MTSSRALQQLDGRQDAVAVQAVGVQPSGWKFEVVTISRGWSNSASSSRCRIIASVTSATWNSSKQISRKRAMRLPSSSSGLTVPFRVLQLAVHLAHELVEVQPGLARQRHGLEEAVHQEALAPPHAAHM
jgi:hypothetical protein